MTEDGEETGVRSHGSGVGDQWEEETERRKTEDGGRRTDLPATLSLARRAGVRGRRTVDGGQWTDNRRQAADDEGQRAKELVWQNVKRVLIHRPACHLPAMLRNARRAGCKARAGRLR